MTAHAVSFIIIPYFKKKSNDFSLILQEFLITPKFCDFIDLFLLFVYNIIVIKTHYIFLRGNRFERNYCPKTVYSSLYLARRSLSAVFPFFVNMEKEIRDRVRRTDFRRRIFCGRLRYISSRFSRKNHFRRSQSFLGITLDVNELRFYEFCVDLALDIKR